MVKNVAAQCVLKKPREICQNSGTPLFQLLMGKLHSSVQGGMKKS